MRTLISHRATVTKESRTVPEFEMFLIRRVVVVSAREGVWEGLPPGQGRRSHVGAIGHETNCLQWQRRKTHVRSADGRCARRFLLQFLVLHLFEMDERAGKIEFSSAGVRYRVRWELGEACLKT